MMIPMDNLSINKTNSLYQLDELMTQTRRLAAEYRLQTGQILPISNELAKYDVQHILDLCSPSPELKLKSVDCILPGTHLNFQVKARVVFKVHSPQRVGQLNLLGDWTQTLLVIYDDCYQPDQIYALDKFVILDFLSTLPQGTSNKNKRGAISVGKFKALGKLIWSVERGLIVPMADFFTTGD